jgi:hypothetical protein
MLESSQSRMRDALLSTGSEPLGDILGPSAPRFEIHRRHFIRSLTASLEKTFPAVVNLVDTRFFGFAADAFIRQHPPTTPCLFEFGAALPGFIEAFPACASLPYLGDVARLEWAMHSVFHADDFSNEAKFPAVRLFASQWPVDAIWRVAMGRSVDPVDMNAGKAWVLVYRDDWEVKFESLSEASFAFHTIALHQGEVSAALSAARKRDPNFDEQKAFAQFGRAAKPKSKHSIER